MPLNDDYSSQEGLLSSAEEWVAVTPHDTNNLGFLPKAIMVGATAGNVVMIDKFGNTATVPFDAGEIKPLRPAIIKATSTTATPIYALR
jgi:hypothetical protein